MVENATGLWNVSDYGSTPKFNAAKRQELSINKKDKEILKGLAAKVSEFASSPAEDEKRKLWTDHNMLKTKRPVVFCDPENGWNEIITEDKIECTGSLARRWEVVLKKEIFWADSIKDDKVIEQYFDIGYTFTDDGWGLDSKVSGGRDGGSYVWEAPVKNAEDVTKLHYPKIEVDYKTTEDAIAVAEETFGDHLKIRLIGRWWWTLGLTMDLAFLRGLENIMMDMLDSPELIHQLMSILSDGTLKKIDHLEENGLLSLNNDSYVGSGGFGYTDELPAGGFDKKHIRTNDMWGFGDSQETGSVSPQMFEEFVFPYQLPILEKFGLNCYGCCEPLDKRWEIVKRFPNLRRISVSPWSDLEIMAGNLKADYVFSLKANPAALAVPVMDKELVRQKVIDSLKKTKGCVLEILMKDNHTLGKNPDNIINWVKIVRESIEKIY
jgi:hypothetical protein